VVVMADPIRPRDSGDTPPRGSALRRRREDSPSEDNSTSVMTRVHIEEVDDDEEEEEEEKEEEDDGNDDADDDVDDDDEGAAREAAKVKKDRKWHAEHHVPYALVGATFEVVVGPEQDAVARIFERTGDRAVACVVCREADPNYKELKKQAYSYRSMLRHAVSCVAKEKHLRERDAAPVAAAGADWTGPITQSVTFNLGDEEFSAEVSFTKAMVNNQRGCICDGCGG
jgi:hypothetical protein